MVKFHKYRNLPINNLTSFGIISGIFSRRFLIGHSVTGGIFTAEIWLLNDPPIRIEPGRLHVNIRAAGKELFLTTYFLVIIVLLKDQDLMTGSFQGAR